MSEIPLSPQDAVLAASFKRAPGPEAQLKPPAGPPVGTDKASVKPATTPPEPPSDPSGSSPPEPPPTPSFEAERPKRLTDEDYAQIHQLTIGVTDAEKDQVLEALGGKDLAKNVNIQRLEGLLEEIQAGGNISC